MNSILGINQSAKFILLGCDVDLLLPKLGEIKRSHKSKKIALYKSKGHFQSDIHLMNQLVYVSYHGLSTDTELGYYWGGDRSAKFITSVVKLDGDSQRDSFFDLKYSDIILDHIYLTNDSIKELKDFCVDISSFISRMKEVKKLTESIEELEKTVNKNKVIDADIKEVSRLLESECFKNAGNDALKFLQTRFENWRKKTKWTN